MMMIHFPAALLPFDLICSFLAFYTGDETFKFASFYAMAGGVIIGCVAITFGALDLLNVFKEKPDAVKIAVVHGSINTCVIMVYTILAYSQYKNYPSLEFDTLAGLILKATLIGLMFAGNYLGGSLILKHGVAVEK